MKRMYVVLSVIILFSLWMLQALGQKLAGPSSAVSRDEQFKRSLEMRDEIHKRMMDKLMNGLGSDDDLFEDMEQMMNDSMAQSFSLPAPSMSALKMDWSESATGRTLVITPEEPSQKIDMDVKNQIITLKGETKIQSPQGSSMSSFSNSFPVPQDCDGSKVKIRHVGGKIFMEFPFRVAEKSQPIKKDSRVPIDPQGDEVTI